jgi:hypothetical protein
VVARGKRSVVTNELVYLETVGPLFGEPLRNAAIAAISQEYDLAIVDQDSVTIEEVGPDKAANW